MRKSDTLKSQTGHGEKDSQHWQKVDKIGLFIKTWEWHLKSFWKKSGKTNLMDTNTSHSLTDTWVLLLGHDKSAEGIYAHSLG